MEMLNIPPVQPKTNPTAAAKGNVNKTENSSFQNVLGKANKNAQNPQQKGSANSTGDEGTELNGSAQPAGEATEVSQPLLSAEGEESSTELDAEDAPSVALALGAAPDLPVQSAPAHKAEPALMVSNRPKITEDTKPADMPPLLSEVKAANAKAEVKPTNQEASVTKLTPDASVTKLTPDASVTKLTPDVASQKVPAKNTAPVPTGTTTSLKNAVSTATTTQGTTTGAATESLPGEKMNVVDSTLPAEGAQRIDTTDPKQKLSTPANAEAIASQTLPAKNSEQTGRASSEAGKQTGLMESSLGNLLQEVRPLREQSRGRQAANLNRGETASIAIQTEKSAQVVAGAQSKDSLPSFAAKKENGFSAMQAEATANGSRSADTTLFEAVMEKGLNSSAVTQQGSQQLQAASAEPGSIRLASGEFLSENQIVNQVLDRISVERAGNLSRIVIRMNPEELGEVKLSLTFEKDQLKAQLLTQNQQVQEILEKHLPKLHEALSQQGVKLEDIQVGVDSNRHSGQETFANHRQPDSFRRQFNAPTGISNDPVHPATASARSVSTEGLSLRI